MNQQKHVLIVEDEPKIAQILVEFLQLEDFQATVLHDGKNVIEFVKKHSPDFVILDVMLPFKDGYTLCKEIRQFSTVPILMLTARVDEIDRIMGLGIGADDYVCKPFSAREVVARVQAILRRFEQQSISLDNVVTYKNIQLDLARHQTTVADVHVELTPVEFRLLLALVKRPGVVFSRDQLMNTCYEDERIVSSRTIDSHMKNLRAKLQIGQSANPLLHSIYGVGYKIE
ncbi:MULTISPECIES: response regulator [Aliiglaciecola]|uniref:response regulator n=1 Tax=Aliiglaciecola TaxID=1406885 RepID=UPI001C089793|nr:MULTISPECIES: response regulator [unclassified Aliiglaciecola]MBU2878469.1 response regulator [Aliiglaciecola lipolytica]MDO6709715.1 response regulator [Aliiglaciecola sp. 2_MG-2023]MDO6750743.1 response regulator [Aliiglaciecola sp. 1_MG-2023]